MPASRHPGTPRRDASAGGLVVKLIYHEHLEERHWIEWLLGDVVTKVIIDPDHHAHGGDVIQVVSGNSTPYRHRHAFFEACRKASHNLTLWHVGDEWLSGGYDTYRYFDRVIKNHGSRLAMAPGIFTAPLGYPNGGGETQPLPGLADRPHVWSFAGSVKASRADMIRGLERVPGGLVHDTAHDGHLNREQYQALMRRSVFVPSPMGNVFIETWRTYEALEHGCIPIVERRATLDYYRMILGDDPMPRVSSWRAAPALIEALTRDPAALEVLRARVSGWWSEHKQEVRDGLARFMQERHAEDLGRYAARPHIKNAALYRPLQMAELMRHQSLGSATRRALRPLERLRGRHPK